MADLLPNAKKAYYEQDGKQFIFEPAWQIVKNLPKRKLYTRKSSKLLEATTRSSQNQEADETRQVSFKENQNVNQTQ
ncbi:hypothetical protein PCASD_02108 [Puccinia coronata f. sp. avenae]|uniref:Uncharacterized protein n=1 Tax=Puccinia coronata f. sp. avenae TaxID=200324 RepID=A0A2N5VQ17_9BASI|nr:hypothetical protein PCASD_02108 [Puccinia coronata f. sp. avenae]